MSIQPHQGILNIPNATLRVGKLAVDSTAGFDTVFNSVSKNTILLEDVTEYTVTKQWDLKMPNIFVATFKIKGAGSSFNFQNTSVGTAVNGYTLLFSGTTLTLKYDDGDLATATISNLDSVYGKVYVTFEKQYFTVTIDGTRVLTYKDTGTRTPPEGEFVNFFAGTGGAFEELKVVAGNWISDGTSNVALMGGNLDVHGEVGVTSNLEVGTANLFVDTVNSRVGLGTSTPGATLDVSGNVYVSSNLTVTGDTTVSSNLTVTGNTFYTNPMSIFVGSNVVAEYTGPHDRPLRKYPEVAMTQNDESATSGYVASGSTIFSAAYEYYEAFDLKTNLVDTNPDLGLYGTWLSAASKFDSSGIAETGIGTSNTFPGTSYRGEYCALKIPNAIKLDNFHIFPRGDASSYANSNPPKDLRVFGSNDGTTWTHIKQFQNFHQGENWITSTCQ